MEVATKLAMFAGALVLAVVAGWGLGQLVAPYLPAATPPYAVPVHDHPATPRESP